MAYSVADYMGMGSRPDPETHVNVLFRVEAPDFRRAAGELAAESSVGTWTEVAMMSERILKKLAAKVYWMDKGKKLVRVSYPIDMFEDGNMPQILSDIAGNIYGMKVLDRLRLIDIDFPKAVTKTFPGPQIGLEGIRKIIGTGKSRRPHCGTIVKPKIGLGPKEHAKVAYQAWSGGLDLVKDDENLSSQRFNPFEDRIVATLELKDRAESETGEKKIYAPNITARSDIMLERADFVKEHGGNCIMVDVVTAGFAGLQHVRAQNYGMALHAHRAMYAAFARDETHGFSMLALAKCLRLAGVDQLHIGAIVGKMEGSAEDVLQTHRAIQGDMHGLKPVMSACSGGMSPMEVPALLKIIGNDIIIQAGGGVHGHPDGTVAGAKALRQSIEAALGGKTLQQYAKTHPELARAIEKWGYRMKKNSPL
ncbi:MAG: type III ribulose-bisphosphate carboxylase [Candidatus Micrarchaeia archaeon]